MNRDLNAVKTGEFLAALRRSHGYTQQQVAEQLHLSNKTVSKWESGGGFPDVSVLPALAELYGVTADDILAGERLHRREERATAARRHYLLSRAALPFKLCYVLAAVPPAVELLSTALTHIAALWNVYLNEFSGFGRWGALCSVLLILVGEMLACYGLQGAAAVCAAAEIGEAKRTFFRQGFSLAAINLLFASYELYFSPPLAALPVVLLLAVWYLLYRRCGRLFTPVCRLLFLLACLGAALYSPCVVVWHRYAAASVLMVLSPVLAGLVALLQVLPDRSAARKD